MRPPNPDNLEPEAALIFAENDESIFLSDSRSHAMVIFDRFYLKTKPIPNRKLFVVVPSKRIGL